VETPRADIRHEVIHFHLPSRRHHYLAFHLQRIPKSQVYSIKMEPNDHPIIGVQRSICDQVKRRYRDLLNDTYVHDKDMMREVSRETELTLEQVQLILLGQRCDRPY